MWVVVVVSRDGSSRRFIGSSADSWRVEVLSKTDDVDLAGSSACKGGLDGSGWSTGSTEAIGQLGTTFSGN